MHTLAGFNDGNMSLRHTHTTVFDNGCDVSSHTCTLPLVVWTTTMTTRRFCAHTPTRFNNNNDTSFAHTHDNDTSSIISAPRTPRLF